LLLVSSIICLVVTFINLLIGRRFPNFKFTWILNTAFAFIVWALTLIGAFLPTQQFFLFSWQLEDFLTTPPVFLQDEIAWPFGFGLSSLLLFVILTLPARTTVQQPYLFAANFGLIGSGVLAAMVANPLTAVLVWALIDLVELVVFLLLFQDPGSRKSIVNTLSLRLAGLLLLLTSNLFASGQPRGENFLLTTNMQALFVFSAIGLRLGLIPLHVPGLSMSGFRRGTGTILRMTPTIASLVVLSRIDGTSLSSNWLWFILSLVLLAGLYGAVGWIIESDVLDGRSFWLIGFSAFAFASALFFLQESVIALSLAMIFGGSFQFLSNHSLRVTRLLTVIYVFLISGLPYLPLWPAMNLFGSHSVPIGISFMLLYIIFLSGIVRSGMSTSSQNGNVEAWRFVVYTLGHILFFVSFAIYGIWSIIGQQWAGPIWPGFGILLLTTLVLLVNKRIQKFIPEGLNQGWQAVVSIRWLRNFTTIIFNQIARAVNAMTGILEGESGILWSFIFLITLLSILNYFR
jgi:hypothetical protein